MFQLSPNDDFLLSRSIQVSVTLVFEYESDPFVYFLCTLFSFVFCYFLNFAGENNQDLNSMLNIIKLLRLCIKSTQDQGKNSISQHQESAFMKRFRIFALAS